MIVGSLPKEAVNKIFTDNWPIRRRWMKIATLILVANAELVLGFMLWRDDGGTPIQLQILMYLVGAGLAITFAYVFGAIWDDSNKMRALRRLGTAGSIPSPEPDAPVAEPETE